MEVARQERGPAVDFRGILRIAVVGESRLGMRPRQVAQDRCRLRQHAAIGEAERRHRPSGIHREELGAFAVGLSSFIGLADPFEHDVRAQRAGTGRVVEREHVVFLLMQD